jgi:hypothetical protein
VIPAHFHADEAEYYRGAQTFRTLPASQFRRLRIGHHGFHHLDADALDPIGAQIVNYLSDGF